LVVGQSLFLAVFTSAFFQRVGRHCYPYDALRIRETGRARINEYSFKPQLGMLSGPAALLILSFDKALCTINSDTFEKTGGSSNGSLDNGDCKSCIRSVDLKTPH
jgi:hypothetical protein